MKTESFLLPLCLLFFSFLALNYMLRFRLFIVQVTPATGTYR